MENIYRYVQIQKKEPFSKFTYKYGTTSYYVGAALDFESNVIYLKVQ